MRKANQRSRIQTMHFIWSSYMVSLVNQSHFNPQPMKKELSIQQPFQISQPNLQATNMFHQDSIVALVAISDVKWLWLWLLNGLTSIGSVVHHWAWEEHRENFKNGSIGSNCIRRVLSKNFIFQWRWCDGASVCRGDDDDSKRQQSTICCFRTFVIILRVWEIEATDWRFLVDRKRQLRWLCEKDGDVAICSVYLWYAHDCEKQILRVSSGLRYWYFEK